MNPNAPQSLARTLLVEANHLSRLAFANDDDELSARFAALRTSCASLERNLGASPPRYPSAAEIDRIYQRVLDLASNAVGREPRALLDKLVRDAQRLRPPQPRTLLGLPAAGPTRRA